MSSHLRAWLSSLRTTHDPRPAFQRTDGELVSAFAESHDDNAFAELVRRHGPMVLATCRRVLHPDIHTADDAFQAAFLVLATKAGLVSPPERVGAWLHGVAVHVAKKARAWVRKVAPSAPSDLDKVPAHFTEPDPDAAQVRAMIDDVLAGLPAKYRAPVILCELEGRSRAAAARALGWTEGTLSGRLARARKLLADRFARRGIALPAAGLAVALLTQPATASVPAHLAASTVQAAALVAAGAATAEVASGPVAALAREGCPTMTTTLKVLAAGVAGIGLTLGGFGLVNLLDRPTNAAPPTPAAALANIPLPTFASAEKGWVATHTFTYKNPVTAVVCGPDIVVAGDKAGALVIWDAKTGQVKETIQDGTEEGFGPIDRLQISPDGESLHLVTHDLDRFHLCSVEKQGRKYPGFGGNGGWKVYGTTADGSHWLEAIKNKDLAMMPNTLAMNVFGGLAEGHFLHEDEIQYAAAGPADSVATVAGGVLRRWTKDKEKPLWDVKLESFEPTALAVASDGKMIALAGKEGEVRLYPADTGKLATTLKGHTGEIHAVAFSPDGKRLVTTGEDKTARIFDTETGKELAVLKGHTEKVTCAAFSPGGEQIATGSADKTVKVWEFKK